MATFNDNPMDYCYVPILSSLATSANLDIPNYAMQYLAVPDLGRLPDLQRWPVEQLLAHPHIASEPPTPTWSVDEALQYLTSIGISLE